MRDYAKVCPKAWHGQTMKALRKRGSKALLVGLYLMTSPSSNMLGIFTQPVLYMAHETGLGEEGAMEGLSACIEEGFCSYDRDSEVVWVHEMAKYQIAESLKASDLRCKGIQKEYDALPDNPFLEAFFDHYSAAFHMTRRRSMQGATKGASKGGSKPLRSQEQEQEQEQEQDLLSPPAPPTTAPAADMLPPPPPAPPATTPAPDPRGSRLPPDWELPSEWRAWCLEHRPDLEPQQVADQFRDFWVGKAGKDGRKADWLATWRNWCRAQKPGNRKPGASGAETFV